MWNTRGQQVRVLLPERFAAIVRIAGCPFGASRRCGRSLPHTWIQEISLRALPGLVKKNSTLVNGRYRYSSATEPPLARFVRITSTGFSA